MSKITDEAKEKVAEAIRGGPRQKPPESVISQVHRASAYTRIEQEIAQRESADYIKKALKKFQDEKRIIRNE